MLDRNKANTPASSRHGMRRGIAAIGWSLYFIAVGALFYLWLRSGLPGESIIFVIALVLIAFHLRALIDGISAAATEGSSSHTVLLYLVLTVLICGAITICVDGLHLWSGWFSSTTVLGTIGERLARSALVVDVLGLPGLFGFGCLIGMRYAGPFAAGSVFAWMVLVPLIWQTGFEPPISDLFTSSLDPPELTLDDYHQYCVKPIAVGAVAIALVFWLFRRVVEFFRSPRDWLHNLFSSLLQAESSNKLTPKKLLRLEITGTLLVLVFCFAFASSLLEPSFDLTFKETPQNDTVSNIPDLPAPQANMIAAVSRGLLSDPAHQPWVLYLIGGFTVVVTLLSGMPALVFALGMYLSSGTALTVFFGALFARLATGKDSSIKSHQPSRLVVGGGLIAGSMVFGFVSLVVRFAFFGRDSITMVPGPQDHWFGLASFTALAIVMMWFIRRLSRVHR